MINTKPKLQQYREAVAKVLASQPGITKQAAFRLVASELGASPGSVSQGYYTRPGRKAPGPENHLQQAQIEMQKAIRAIDLEVTQARSNAQRARKHYETIRSQRAVQRSKLRRQLKSLDNSLAKLYPDTDPVDGTQ
jgi:predicted transcriptional regulator